MISANNINILNLELNNLLYREVFSIIDDTIKEDRKIKMFIPNVEFLMLSRRNKKFSVILKNGDIILNDGMGLYFCSKLLSPPGFREKQTGTDFIHELAKHCEEKKYTLFFLGGRPGVAEEARKKMTKMYKDLEIVGVHHGFFSDENRVIEKINNINPQILMVCLGMLKQEEFIHRNFDRLRVNFVFGNGGALDFLSGRRKRAPRWMIKMWLEWLFRLKEDFTLRRLKRLSVLPLFLFLVIKELINRDNRNKSSVVIP